MIIVMKTTIMFFTIFKNMITITVAMTIVMLIADHGNENYQSR